MRRILNLAASRAGKITAEQRLKHQDQRITLTPGQLLLKHIRSIGPSLGNRNTHRFKRNAKPGLQLQHPQSCNITMIASLSAKNTSHKRQQSYLGVGGENG